MAQVSHRLVNALEPELPSILPEPDVHYDELSWPQRLAQDRAERLRQVVGVVVVCKNHGESGRHFSRLSAAGEPRAFA